MHSCFRVLRCGGICNAPLPRAVGADPVSARQAEAGDDPLHPSSRWGKRPLHSCFRVLRYGGIYNAPLRCTRKRFRMMQSLHREMGPDSARRRGGSCIRPAAEAGDDSLHPSARRGSCSFRSSFRVLRYGGICNAPLHRIVGADPVSARQAEAGDDPLHPSSRWGSCPFHSSFRVGG